MPVGGKTDNLHGKPVAIRGKLKSLHDGAFIEPEVRHGGGRYHNMGPTAVIEVEGGTREDQNLLVLTTRRIVPYSMHQLISLGIYPERQKILVAKGTVAPRAGYEPVSAEIILSGFARIDRGQSGARSHSTMFQKTSGDYIKGFPELLPCASLQSVLRPDSACRTRA